MSSSHLPTVHRYLWAQGTLSAPLPAGTVLAERYRVLQFPLLQDTIPEAAVPPLETVPALAGPYLSLSPFSIAIPRPFTQVATPQSGEPLLLLEEIPIQVPEGDRSEPPSLLPSLATAWPQADALHQTAWLWQIAELWQPCLDYHVGASLLDWQNIRVDGEDIRLVTLEASEATVTLADLGRQWRMLVKTATPPVRAYLTRLTDHLESGAGTSLDLRHSLTQALEEIAADRTVKVQVATYSDQGPTRRRNEDACYPSSGFVGAASVTAATADQGAAPLVVVCDGIGGHQGGDVASGIAIAEVTRHLKALVSAPSMPHQAVVDALKDSILAANHAIATQNNAAKRRDRDRMGTTIVMALVYGARLYIAHLGDSRAYRIRPYNCRQLTLDDDVAAREMRLGLELYQDALQSPGSGALVQALGMAASKHLHPTVTMHPIASDALILLCSDGLSDHDLVNKLSVDELVPVLRGDRDIARAGTRLIDLANTYNGHDNVTVGLLHLSPQPHRSATAIAASTADLLITGVVPTAPPQVRSFGATPTQLSAPASASSRSNPAMAVLVGVLFAGLLGIGGAIAWQWFARRSLTEAPPTLSDTGETLSPSAQPPSSLAGQGGGDISVGDFLQIRPRSDPSAAATVYMTDSPPESNAEAAVDLPERLLPTGSIVQVDSRQQAPNDRVWVYLEVCSVTDPVPETAVLPESTASSTEPAESSTEVSDRVIPLTQPGDQGWLLESDLSLFSNPLLDIEPAQRGVCAD